MDTLHHQSGYWRPSRLNLKVRMREFLIEKHVYEIEISHIGRGRGKILKEKEDVCSLGELEISGRETPKYRNRRSCSCRRSSRASDLYIKMSLEHIQTWIERTHAQPWHQWNLKLVSYRTTGASEQTNLLLPYRVLPACHHRLYVHHHTKSWICL
jgi:hypothetical protein